jgi:serine/threonine protein kinase
MKATSTDPFLGMVIRGYSLEELLGHGSLTAVYRAHTEELWQVPELIITILLVPDTFSEQAHARFKTRFMREAKRLALLRHHYLFPLYGYGEQEGLFYLLTPPVQGEALTKSLRQKRAWSLSELLSLLVPLATVLDFLHSQGLRYQFFNPANVLIQPDQTVLLSGLGLPQLLSLQGLEKERKDMKAYDYLKSVTGTFLGLPEYLAPEVVKGAVADSRSDVYSLGILLFELLSGSPPFTGKHYLEIAQKHVREPLPSLHKIRPDLPVALELVLNRALHRNPDHRFQILKEFITAYAQVAERRINAPESMNLTQAISSMKALPTPELEQTIPREEDDFLLAGDDALFPQEPEHESPSAPPRREVITENIRMPDAPLIPFPGNTPLPVNRASPPAYRAVSQTAEQQREPEVVAFETGHGRDEKERIAKALHASIAVNRLQILKQQLELGDIS